MSASSDRLIVLARDIIASGDSLIAGATPETAAAFLDRVVRVSAFPKAERVEMGVEPVLEHAQAFMVVHRRALERLTSDWVISTESDVRTEKGFERLLCAATIISWLDPWLRDVVEEEIVDALMLTIGDPGQVTAGARRMACDRLELEKSSALVEPLLRAFANDAPDDPGQGPSEAAVQALERAFARFDARRSSSSS